MNIKICALSLIFGIILISCNDSREKTNFENSEINDSDTALVIKNEISAFDRDSIMTTLEGKWKEPEYPFRVAHFINATVKFIEEGLIEEPRFKEYQILKECPFEVNNIKNAGPNDIFFVMTEAKTCEILNISNDSLILSGFNVTTNSNYNIIYKKVK